MVVLEVLMLGAAVVCFVVTTADAGLTALERTFIQYTE